MEYDSLLEDPFGMNRKKKCLVKKIVFFVLLPVMILIWMVAWCVACFE